MTFDPHHNPCQRIEDMLDAIASIKESVTGVSYAQFLANREKRQSVAYDIEIIGEAANAIDKSVQEKYPAVQTGRRTRRIPRTAGNATSPGRSEVQNAAPFGAAFWYNVNQGGKSHANGDACAEI